MEAGLGNDTIGRGAPDRMIPPLYYSFSFPSWLGSLWLAVTFVWLLLPLCRHLWYFGGHYGRSSLVEYARDGVLRRISLVFVAVSYTHLTLPTNSRV